jgi:hypothetical protein
MCDFSGFPYSGFRKTKIHPINIIRERLSAGIPLVKFKDQEGKVKCERNLKIGREVQIRYSAIKDNGFSNPMPKRDKIVMNLASLPPGGWEPSPQNIFLRSSFGDHETIVAA